MASPSISSIAAVQGTGAIVKQSVIEVTVSFSADNPCNFTVQWSQNNGSTWHDTVLHPLYNGLSVPAGAGKTILIDIDASIAADNTISRTASSTNKVRALATDPIQSLSSSNSTTSSLSVKSTTPVISSATLPTYVGISNASAATLTMTAQNGDGSTAPSLYRANLSLSQLDPGSSLAFTAYSTPTTFAFQPGATDGPQTVYLRVYDSYYNASAAYSITTWLQRQRPYNCVVNIYGTQGNQVYTGIKINDDGTLTPDRTATLHLRATSPLTVQYMIRNTSGVELLSNIGNWYTLNSGSSTPGVSLTTNQGSPTSDNFNTDATVYVIVDFQDQAGNTTTVTTPIRLNTRIYLTAHTPMQKPDATYQPILKEVTSGGNEVAIPQSMTLQGLPIRAWRDIFYPTSHSYPVDGNGNLDTTAAIAMNQVSNTSYDAVLLNNGAIVYDAQARPITTGWTADGTKNYGNMLSSSVGNLVYWVIDNTGHGAYNLEFEFFNLSNTSYGPPFNNMAPYRGDVLVVYDANTNGALTPITDQYGQPGWALADSTKLVEMMAFTGTGSNVLNLTNGQRANSNPAGAFTTDLITGRDKLVLILYTDAAGTGTGFKLKSSVAYDQLWYNYDTDTANGQLWVHKYSTLGSAAGAADPTSKRLIYGYYDKAVNIDYETGVVSFGANPSGVVTADYCYYEPNQADWINTPGASGSPHGPDRPQTLLASWDDFVAYSEAPVFVCASGQNTISASGRTHVFETDGYGRLTLNYAWDTDRGVLTFSPGTPPPSGVRVVADYNHHTYLRLTNDGFGDLTFRDPVVVADTTPVFPDYTFGDIKVVNEGDAMLEAGSLSFVPYGYDENNDGEVVLIGTGVVDQVLDINRPWQIQMGTSQETWTKMAAQISDNFLWDRSCSKEQAMLILGTWRGQPFGNLAARARKFGRVVWVLGGTGGGTYPPTTFGPKVTGVQVAGKFYNQFIS